METPVPGAERLRAVCDLQVAAVRELAGLHRYDGVVQDLSPAGVAAGLARLGVGDLPHDPVDAAYLQAVEAGLRAELDACEEHRRNPLLHVGGLDLACYDRGYAPAEERAQARRRHLAAWPDAVDAAVASLDSVPAPVAVGLLPAVRGLGDGVDDPAALAAHARLVAHVEGFVTAGDPDPALGAARLARLMGDPEGLPVDLDEMEQLAERERDRMRALLEQACARLAPGEPLSELLPRLLSDHPDTPEEIYAEARAQIVEATRFTVEHDLLADPGGVCLVGPAPPSRRWAMAMMSWSAPHEPDAPSWYHVTPPDPGWPAQERDEWLAVFSRTTLPAITVHEVTPGHYAHGRALRRLASPVRSTVGSATFAEGWAHHVEELFVEEGFRDGDPRFAVGVALEALVRTTRLAVAVGVHARGMTVDEAARRFTADALLGGSAARSEADRATFDAGYGRYTWGKAEIRRQRERARAAWGPAYSHRRYHEALLALGSPPLGLVGEAVRAG